MAVKKYLKSEHDYENNTMLLKTLKKAVTDNKLEMATKSSYTIPGEIYAPPADMTVTIENDKVCQKPSRLLSQSSCIIIISLDPIRQQQWTSFPITDTSLQELPHRA